LSRDFAFYVLQGVTALGVEIGVTERPAMFAELIIIRVFDFMKIIFIKLSHEACKVRMLKHAWEYGFCEFVHVFYDKRISAWGPRDCV